MINKIDFLKECPTSALINWIKEFNNEPSIKAQGVVSLMTSMDGDYFLDICNEDGGGIDLEVEFFFKSRPIAKKLMVYEILDTLKTVSLIPCFTSLNGCIKLNYLVHIWIFNHYIIHDPVLRKTHCKKMRMSDRLFHKVETPPWLA